MANKRWTGALVSLLLAAAFVLVFGECNTPLGPRIGSDNAMYLTMGTALAQGAAPYRDIFDHKGPLLFALQALAQLPTKGYSTLAVYAMEALFLFASLRFVSAMARRLGLGCAAAQLAFLACLGPFMDGGNLTEEYAALFILAGASIALSVFDGGDGLGGAQPKKLLAPAFLLGAMAMLAFLLRANNALGLCGLTLGLALALAMARRWRSLGVCAGGFALGCAAAAAPVVAWLARHGALADAWYASIIHNMMYAETTLGLGRMQMLLHSGYGHSAILLAALCCAGALAAWLRTGKIATPLGMAGAAAFAGLSCFLSHKFYIHYLMVMSPFAAMGVLQLLAFAAARGGRAHRAAQALTIALAIAVLGASGYAANANRLHELEIQGAFEQDAKELFALVPEDERDDFMAYRVEPKWYVYAEALPCMRFYFLQEILADADPMVMEEIVAEFETDPPKWLVLYYNREFGPPYDARVAEIFDTRYEFIDARGQYQLKRLKP